MGLAIPIKGTCTNNVIAILYCISKRLAIIVSILYGLVYCMD